MSTLVIGVGSPFGDDRAGWEVVAALGTVLPAGVRACTFDRPGARLASVLAGVEHAVVVDALREADSPPGSLRWLAETQLEALSSASSHGFGVAEALALARTLGDAPRRVDVLAISAARFEGDGLSDALRAVVPDAVRAILSRIGEFRAQGADASARGGASVRTEG